MSRIIRGSESRILPPGTHDVTIARIEEVDNPSDVGRMQLQIDLESAHAADGINQSIRLWTSPVLHPKGKLLPLIEAALGRTLTPLEFREGFDIDELIGLRLRVVIKEGTSLSGRTFSKVAGMLPVEAESN